VTPLEAHLAALDVLEAGLLSASVDDLVERARPDLEVRSREDLIRVVLAVGAEVRRSVPRGQRAVVLAGVQRRRLAVMMDGSQ
jgi:hypothetical protein